MNLISVAEAKKVIANYTEAFPPVNMVLQNAAGMTLASAVYSKMDIPVFNQSSMDGYALNFSGWQHYKRLKIIGELSAGSRNPAPVLPQDTARIFTGAAVPSGADTVVMQEKIRIENGELIVDDDKLESGANVRLKGSEIRSGDLALAEQCMLTPAAIGFLTGIGITNVMVYPKPVVSIIITGNELQEPGRPLLPGQVYESNSHSLKAALNQIHLNNIQTYRAEDTLEMLTKIMQTALEQSDVVLLTGGMSVGAYDFVIQAAANNGVNKIFHKVRQKPGKPFYFGKKERQYIFGLPGNPASVLTCFYEYVLPALEKMTKRSSGLQTAMVPLAKTIKKSPGLTHFLKGYYDGHSALPLDAQESFRLRSFAKANCLIQINEEVEECKAGDMVEIHLLPQ